MEAMNILRCVTFLAVLLSVNATCYVDDVVKSGSATFYSWAYEAGNGEGACGYNVTGAGVEVVAIGGTEGWGNSQACGMCIEVTGPTGDSLEVIVVDRCPTCGEGDLDLSQTGFNAISGGGKGMVSITWREIECPVLSAGIGFVYIFVYATPDAGTPAQMRIFNHRHKINKVERLQPHEVDADWFNLPRGNNGNYGVPKSHRTVKKPFHVRLTSGVTGEVINETLYQNPKNGIREFMVGTEQFTTLCPSDDGDDNDGNDGTVDGGDDGTVDGGDDDDGTVDGGDDGTVDGGDDGTVGGGDGDDGTVDGGDGDDGTVNGGDGDGGTDGGDGNLDGGIIGGDDTGDSGNGNTGGGGGGGTGNSGNGSGSGNAKPSSCFIISSFMILVLLIRIPAF